MSAVMFLNLDTVFSFPSEMSFVWGGAGGDALSGFAYEVIMSVAILRS